MLVMLRAIWPSINNIRKCRRSYSEGALAEGRCSESFTREFGDDVEGPPLFLPVLVHLAPSHLVPHTPNVRPNLVSSYLMLVLIVSTQPPPLHRQVDRGAHCRDHILHLVHHQGRSFTPLHLLLPPDTSAKQAGGVGPVIHQPSTVHGSELSWTMVIGMMSSISNMATLIVYAPPFAFPPHRHTMLKTCTQKCPGFCLACEDARGGGSPAADYDAARLLACVFHRDHRQLELAGNLRRGGVVAD